jgi:hypothetical protein
VIGAILGVCFGLLWKEFNIFPIMLGVLGGAYFGYGLSFGPKADVYVALIGLFVGGGLSVLRLIIQGNIAYLNQELILMGVLAILSSIAWKGMFIGTRNIRIGGVVGTIAGMLLFFFNYPMRNDNVTTGLHIVTAIEFAPLGTIVGIGLVYKPWFALSLGVILGISSWFGFGFGSDLSVNLPQRIVFGLCIAGAMSGVSHVMGD